MGKQMGSLVGRTTGSDKVLIMWQFIVRPTGTFVLCVSVTMPTLLTHTHILILNYCLLQTLFIKGLP